MAGPEELKQSIARCPRHSLHIPGEPSSQEWLSNHHPEVTASEYERMYNEVRNTRPRPSLRSTTDSSPLQVATKEHTQAMSHLSSNRRTNHPFGSKISQSAKSGASMRSYVTARTSQTGFVNPYQPYHLDQNDHTPFEIEHTDTAHTDTTNGPGLLDEDILEVVQ